MFASIVSDEMHSILLFYDNYAPSFFSERF